MWWDLNVISATGIPGNMAFVKFSREFPGFFSSLNLDYLCTTFTVKNLNYALQNNGTLLHEVTLKFSKNDCFRISVTQAFSILHWSAMSIQYSDKKSLQVLYSTSWNRFSGL